jgi:hypothetical protein
MKNLYRIEQNDRQNSSAIGNTLIKLEVNNQYEKSDNQ